MIVALILFSSVITAIITAVELYIDYKSDITRIENRFQFISDSYLPTLTQSVWVSDDEQIKTQLDGLSRLQDIETLSIVVDGVTQWQVGSKHSVRVMKTSVPLVRQYRGQNIVIGTLYITASVDNVIQRMLSKLVTILISNGIKTLLVAFFMLLIFQFLVGWHLEHIAEFLRSMTKRPDDRSPLKLFRADAGRWRPDALDHVSNAINAMRTSQHEHNQEILQLNTSLDQRVKERTAELEKLNQQLNEAILKLEESNKVKTTFLSRMSHELRTPLNAVCGFSHLLEMEPLSESQREYVDWIHKSGDHLLSLINDLLDLSRIEVNSLKVFNEPVYMTSLLDNAISMTNMQREQKNISLDNNCDNGHIVVADATRAAQIFINLLSNAVKYTQNNGAISIECNIVDGDRLRIYIIDNGQGIPQSKQHLVFTAFERLGAEFTEVEGTGTGLALSKHLAELMHGNMGFSSTEGQGSSFWLELPLGEMGIEQEDTTSSEIPPKRENCCTVLYVEDNIANLRMVENIFKHYPEFTLLSATNGPEGLSMALEQHPDLILLDIHLPGMDGYEVLKQLRDQESTESIPVVALTADAMSNDVNQGLNAGFNRYLTKPIKPSKLISVIRSILRD